jgi:hypothetical protein
MIGIASLSDATIVLPHSSKDTELCAVSGAIASRAEKERSFGGNSSPQRLDRCNLLQDCVGETVPISGTPLISIAPTKRRLTRGLSAECASNCLLGSRALQGWRCVCLDARDSSKTRSVSSGTPRAQLRLLHEFAVYSHHKSMAKSTARPMDACLM